PAARPPSSPTRPSSVLAVRPAVDAPVGHAIVGHERLGDVLRRRAAERVTLRKPLVEVAAGLRRGIRLVVPIAHAAPSPLMPNRPDRKSTRLNSSHVKIS